MGSGWRRALRLFLRPVERDVDDELDFHFEQRCDDLQATGLDRAVALAQATAEFGARDDTRRGLVRIDRTHRRRRAVLEQWEWLVQDLRYVLRSLRRSPGFVVTVVLTLSVGLGANVAIYSILDRLFLAPPPGIPNAAQVWRLSDRIGSHPGSAMSNEVNVFSTLAYPQLQALASQVPGIRVGGYHSERQDVIAAGGAVSSTVAAVVGDYFTVLGTRPAVGRLFLPEELRVTTPTYVAVLSDRAWRDKFSARRDIVGQPIRIGDHPYTIVGVTAPGFHGADNDAADLWVPMNADEPMGPLWYQGAHTFWIKTVLRAPIGMRASRITAMATTALRHDGVPLDSASTAQVHALAGGDADEFVSRETAIAARLSGVAFILLLIACANIANLLLARGMHRRHELAVRTALGIPRRRLVALLLCESLCVAGGGALAGLLVAFEAAAVLRRMLLPDVHWVDSTVNWRVLLVAAALALITGLLAGLVPAWQLSRPDVTGVLKGSARHPASGRARLRNMLLASQSALSVLMLAAAGLVVRSLESVQRVDTGYDVARLVQVDLSADAAHMSQQPDLERRLPDIARGLAAVPGVEGAAVADMVPMGGIRFVNWYPPGRDTTNMYGPEGPYASYVGSQFFATVGMRILQGRGIAPGDRDDGVGPVVVNQEMARQLWPGRDPLTQCLRLEAANAPCRPVVGVVSNAHADGLIESPSMHFYLPVVDSAGVSDAGVILVRTSPQLTASVSTAIARRLQQAMGSWAEVRVHPMLQNLDRELHPWRTAGALFVTAGLLALIVAMVGVYGTVSYTFSQQSRDIGIRMALGAPRGGVLGQVVREGVRVVLAGALVGVVLAMIAGRLLRSILYQTSPFDPGVLLAVVALLLCMAAGASLLPAWRATRVDPIIALRAE
ncbi:MAG TPA: ADOP family duplicated permease [Gemmatimonadales bacterium]|jgi:predicted permease